MDKVREQAESSKSCFVGSYDDVILSSKKKML
jgi:hypothetical protein